MTKLERCSLLAAAATILVAATPARADTFIVAPNANTNSEGNSDNAFPFNIGGIFTSQRYQQVYDASQFSALTGPVMINEILFRPDAQFGHAFSSTLPDIRIDLSTTSADHSSLSSTYANNVGADDTIVYGGVGGSALSLSSAFTGPSNGPKDFDIVINLTTPFLYDPSAGNLLMDVHNFGGGSTTQFDAAFGSGVSARVWNSSVGSANGNPDQEALVTEFGVSPVSAPEPASFIPLSGLALVLASSARRKRARC